MQSAWKGKTETQAPEPFEPEPSRTISDASRTTSQAVEPRGLGKPYIFDCPREPSPPTTRDAADMAASRA